jgi:hypothetical protein
VPKGTMRICLYLRRGFLSAWTLFFLERKAFVWQVMKLYLIHRPVPITLSFCRVLFEDTAMSLMPLCGINRLVFFWHAMRKTNFDKRMSEP